jgi:betaine-aldehyde dehydrogenase
VAGRDRRSHFHLLQPGDHRAYLRDRRRHGGRRRPGGTRRAASLRTRGWKELGGAERGRILSRAAELIARDLEYLAAIETLEVGKLYRDGVHGDLPATLATFRYYAGYADKLAGRTVALPDYAGRCRLNYTLREPLGVVGAITPWNNPIVVAGWKIAPALAAGNTVVLKPPEDASLSLLRLAELLAEAGVPDGVFNVVPGLGETAGAALAAHPGLDKISLTGSPEVGALIGNHAGRRLLKDVAENREVGDVTTLADSSVMDLISAGLAEGKGED